MNVLGGKKWSRGDSNPGPDKETKMLSTCLFRFELSGNPMAPIQPIKPPYLQLYSPLHHSPVKASSAIRCLIANPAERGINETLTT